MIAHLKQWWYAHVSYILWVIHFLSPSISVWMDAHPKSVIAGIAMLLLVRVTQVNGNQKVSP